MEACAALQASLSEVKNDDDEVEAGAAAVNLRDAVNNLSDEVLQNIVNNYVDNVVVPTYRNLKEKNAELLAAVNAFVANPSNEGFDACSKAWLVARQPWETSEAFLFGPVATFGLDPNMDSWPLDQDAIVSIMNSQNGRVSNGLKATTMPRLNRRKTFAVSTHLNSLFSRTESLAPSNNQERLTNNVKCMMYDVQPTHRALYILHYIPLSFSIKRILISLPTTIWLHVY